MPAKSGSKTSDKKTLLYSAADEPYFVFDTSFRRHGEAPSVLNFSTSLRGYSSYDSDDEGGPVIARLSGFLYQPGYMPEGYGGEYFDVFDMRSGHAVEAFSLLIEQGELLEEALEDDGVEMDLLSSVAYLERMWVHPGLRGTKIALRLLREARHVLARSGLIVLLKAFPDNNGSVAGCRKLADYYRSDERIALRVVSREKQPGWLVGYWESADANEDDEDHFVSVDLTKLTTETDPHRE
jgi:GNAT superfamily N-acetyltransferase